LGADEFALLFAAVDALADAGRRLREGQTLGGSELEALDRRLASGFQGQFGGGAGGGGGGVSGVALHRPSGGEGGVSKGVTGSRGVGTPRWGISDAPPSAVAVPSPPDTPDTPDTPRAAGAQADAHVRIATARLDELLSATGE